MLSPLQRSFAQTLAELCQQAGSAILHFYHQKNLHIQQKPDNTPLTEADLASDRIIHAALNNIQGVPIISEEEPKPLHPEEQPCFWLIDPLDGTYEFIKGSGSFCINIALIQQHRPQFAMIYAPVSRECWFAFADAGAYRYRNGRPQRLRCSIICPPVRLITSTAPMSQRLSRYAQSHLPDHQHVRAGGAIKFCRIAEGLADYYIKLSDQTSEWDIAAGDLILHESGGSLRFLDGSLPQYGCKNDMRNAPFIAAADRADMPTLLKHAQAYIHSNQHDA